METIAWVFCIYIIIVSSGMSIYVINKLNSFFTKDEIAFIKHRLGEVVIPKTSYFEIEANEQLRANHKALIAMYEIALSENKTYQDLTDKLAEQLKEERSKNSKSESCKHKWKAVYFGGSWVEMCEDCDAIKEEKSDENFKVYTLFPNKTYKQIKKDLNRLLKETEIKNKPLQPR